MDIALVPAPKHVERHSGSYRIPAPAAIVAAGTLLRDQATGLQQLQADVASATAQPVERSAAIDHPRAAIRITLDRALGAQAYRLSIDPAGISLVGGDGAGCFYGIQTLRQLLQRHGPVLPCLVIDDQPDFPVRGFYHDCTRGKVPRLDTLFELADRCAALKLNQLQLYVEHTFAFSFLPDLWAGADPLQADEILQLDEYCAQRHIELVPSLSCFGHSYTLLRSPRFAHLNELEIDAAAEPYSLWARMAHYTLDARSDEAVELVRRMIAEYAPLFRSPLFNICCDETFDLGTGRNREAAAREGVGRLYIDFVKRVVDAVHAVDRTPMLWGDILQKHPDCVHELAADAIVLDWCYSTDLDPERTRVFADSGRQFYICPGCSTWCNFLPEMDISTKNIARFAAIGKAHGAAGLLNTDWGDLGHAAPLAAAWFGQAYGAHCAWGAQDELADRAAFDLAYGRLAFGDEGECQALLRACSDAALAQWQHLASDADPGLPAEWRSETGGLARKLLELDPLDLHAAWQRLVDLRPELDRALHRAPSLSEQDRAELSAAAWGCELAQAAVLCLQQVESPDRMPQDAPDPAAVADQLRHFDRRWAELWHARNKPSEHRRLRAILLDLALRLDRSVHVPTSSARGQAPILSTR